MNIDERDLITLSDNNTYLVAKKINYNNVNCYLVVSTFDNTDIKYLYEKDNKLIEIEDEDLFEKVLVEMFKDTDINKLIERLRQMATNQN